MGRRRVSLPILGVVLLAPVLPTMQHVFRGTPGADALVPVTLTVPALVIGLVAPFAGRVVDRFGRTRLLVAALVAYAVLGTAPLWLHALGVDGLVPIVLSRAGVRVTEAAIMTCATTLLADCFSGAERDRWLGLQTVFASLPRGRRRGVRRAAERARPHSRPPLVSGP